MNDRMPSDSHDAIHWDTLNTLLSLGSAQLGQSLLAQLIEDFDRIGRALQSDDTSVVDRAAHELKGLSATVGAHRLADLALVFDAAATQGRSARQDFCTQMRAEIEAVLACLRQAMARPNRA
jgi:HPt (histidine-containing phosphotransfer) domain-containing protein